jgi:hypothetical protein
MKKLRDHGSGYRISCIKLVPREINSDKLIEMKFFFINVVLVFVLLITSSEADIFKQVKKTQIKKGNIVSGQIVWDKKLQIDLGPGEWEVVDHTGWTVSSITSKYAAFAQIINGDTVDKFVEIQNIYLNGKWIDYLHIWLEEVMFKNKYDGCYQRPEYYLLERYKNGAAFNCLIIRHSDVARDLYASDDPHNQHSTAIIRKWLKEKKYKAPPILLEAAHYFYAPQTGRVYLYGVWINPETHGAPKNNFTTEEQSEYHRANIDQYPKKKKFMESFISQQAYMHQKFEEMVGAKPRHKLDLVQYINEKDIKKVIKNKKSKLINNNDNVSKQLKDLNEMYQSGVLTKEQFEKAKNKLLN